MMETTMTDPWAALEEPSTRTPRSLETRDRSQRQKSWAPPSILPEPVPQDGWVFKWVRTSSQGTADKNNVGKRLNEGWEPVRAEDHPEIVMAWNNGQTSGVIETGGLMLCKMSEEMVAQRTEYYRTMTLDNERSADEHHMRDSSELAKKFKEHQRQVVFGQRAR